MRKFSKEELENILDKHAKWLKSEEGGERADLSGSDLSGSILSRSNLRNSDLRESDLSGSILSRSDLSRSNLRNSNLRNSDLRNSDLRGSDLRGSDLSGSILSRSNLRNSDLRESDLSCSDLSGSDLSGSDLSGSKSGAICRMDFGGWSICIRAEETTIGCQKAKNSFWLRAEPKDVALMADKATDWWRIHGPAVKSAIKVVMKKSEKEEF